MEAIKTTNMLTKEDFEETALEDHPVPYYRFTDGTVQICLEPCQGGMCVGIYDLEDWILAEKQCTGFLNKQTKEVVMERAVLIANKMYTDWKIKNIIE